MDINSERRKRIDMIEKALTMNAEVRNAHPWIMPLWEEIQQLRKELHNSPKTTEEQHKTATQILAERKAEAAKAKAPAKKTRKAKTDEEGQG